MLNNLVVFLVLAPFSRVEASDGSPLGLAVTAVSTPLYVWLVLRAARRFGVGVVLPSAPRRARPPHRRRETVTVSAALPRLVA